MLRSLVQIGLASLLWAACAKPAAPPAPRDAEVVRVDVPKTKTSTLAEAVGPQTIFYDYLFHGKKVGYMESVDERVTFEGVPAVRALRNSVITVKREASIIRMESKIEAWSTPEGAPIAFEHERNEGSAIRRIRGKRVGNEFVVELEVAGKSTTIKHPVTPTTYLNSSLDAVSKERFSRCRPNCPRMTGATIVEEDGTLGTFSLEAVADQEPWVIVGKLTIGGTTLTTRETMRGNDSVRIQFDELGAELVATTKEQAMKLETVDDIFTRGRLSSGALLPRPSDNIRELTLELKAKNGGPAKALSGEFQKVVQGMSSTRVTLVAVPTPKKPEPMGFKDPTSPVVVRALAETPYEPISDPAIIEAAKKAAGDAKDRFEAARRVVQFVYHHIEEKSLAQAFSSAKEALESQEGDCTEHAVLASALLKSLKIPAKLVTGLVYVGGHDGGFGYHAWVEVLIEGRWLPMDPTFGQDLADPSHIKFTEGSSDPEGLREAGVAAAELFGNLDLKVTEYVTLDGKKQTL